MKPGFEVLYFKGKEVAIDGIDISATMYFQHLYRTTYTLDGPKEHACLRYGYWCWKNAFDHPQDIILYLRRIRG